MNNTTIKLDVNIARIVHLNWALEIESMMQGNSQMHHIPSQSRCELGQWLHGRAMEQLGWGASLKELITVHNRFHQLGENIHQQLHEQKTINPEEMAIIRELSHEIVFLLTKVELEYATHKREIVITPHPIKDFFQRLFEGPHSARSEHTGVLEINYARLVHLQWMMTLPDYFRHRGKNMALEPEESCALGVWIQSTGIHKFKRIKEVTLLEVAHVQFHYQANATLSALKNKRDSRAENAYASVQKLSKQIIYLLSVIEFKLMGDTAITRSSVLIE